MAWLWDCALIDTSKRRLLEATLSSTSDAVTFHVLVIPRVICTLTCGNSSTVRAMSKKNSKWKTAGSGSLSVPSNVSPSYGHGMSTYGPKPHQRQERSPLALHPLARPGGWLGEVGDRLGQEAAGWALG